MIIEWIRNLFRMPQGREVVCVTYEEGDRLIKADGAWRIAPEEDTNEKIGYVWLERDI